MRAHEQDGLNDDGGCAVDSTWLVGEEIAGSEQPRDHHATFRSAGLRRDGGLWKGAFVAFDPCGAYAAPGLAGC
jgi:hypothetical protein